jgi:GDPmannose 4,6-dehydratase
MQNNIVAKRAVITGITGQDGSYLAEFLLEKGYEVHGIRRRSSSFNTARIDQLIRDPHEKSNMRLHYGDLTDASSLSKIINQICPDEIFNLGAQSHVAVSFEQPTYTFDVNTMGTLRILEIIRNNRDLQKTRLYQASTSEMFGSALPPQNEATSFQPQSPYAISKLAAHELIRNYRASYDLFAVSGILFNHESPRRGETFVTRKITRAVARIVRGEQNELFLGNLDARRDWGYAPDYVVAMWKMLQQKQGDDYVLATGTDLSVKDFVKLSFDHVNLDWEKFVRFDEKYLRPTEVDSLVGDATKAKKALDWKPGVSPQDLASIMVDYDLAVLDGAKIDAPAGAVWANAIK